MLVLRFMTLKLFFSPARRARFQLSGRGYTLISSQHSWSESTSLSSLKKCPGPSPFHLASSTNPKARVLDHRNAEHCLATPCDWIGSDLGAWLDKDIKTYWNMRANCHLVELVHISQMGSNTLYLPKDWRILTHFAGDLLIPLLFHGSLLMYSLNMLPNIPKPPTSSSQPARHSSWWSTGLKKQLCRCGLSSVAQWAHGPPMDGSAHHHALCNRAARDPKWKGKSTEEQ